MAMTRPRSAALLISIYVDEAGGAAWYARLQAFDDPAGSKFNVERLADEAQLMLAVRRWLDAAIPDRSGAEGSESAEGG